MKKKLEDQAKHQSNKSMLTSANNPYHGRADMQQMYHSANASVVPNDSAGKSNPQMQTYTNAKDNAGVPRKMQNQHQRRSSSQMNHSTNSGATAGT